MEDLSNKSLTQALEIRNILEEHKGKDAVVIDLRHLFLWTDFFIIVTVNSSVHLAGLQRQIKEWALEKKLEILRGKKASKDDAWCLTDLGNIVIHLMTEDARKFYELENLWNEGKIIKPAK